MLECLQSVSPYQSAPADVWSLGVILVNLAFGRNPWRQASKDDNTYNAFLKDQDFLKTIFNPSDDLNNILRRIFEPIPDRRITIAELKLRILQCPRLYSTTSPRSYGAPITNSLSKDSACSILPDSDTNVSRSSSSSHDSGYDDDEHIHDSGLPASGSHDVSIDDYYIPGIQPGFPRLLLA